MDEGSRLDLATAPSPVERTLDQLGEPTGSVERPTSRRTSLVAVVAAVVLVAAVVAAISLGRTGGNDELSVADAAAATRAAGSARVTITVTREQVAGTASLSGPVDFREHRFDLRGTYGERAYELRGIGSDTWAKQANGIPGKPWLHMLDLSSAPGGSFADPATLLDELTRKGREVSRTSVGKRTRVALRVPLDAVGRRTPGQAEDVDVTAELDRAGFVRTITITTSLVEQVLAYDDFGIDVAVQPPPVDQVADMADLMGKQFGATGKAFAGFGGGPDGCALLDEQAKAFLAKVSEQQRATFEKFFADARQACAAAK